MERTRKDLFVSRGMTGLLILIIILFSGSVYAQKHVKTDLVPFFEKVLVPPQLCKDAFAKQQELTQYMSTNVQEQMNNYKTKADHDKEVTDKHTGIDEWEKAEIAKLPRITSGEMSEPDL